VRSARDLELTVGSCARSVHVPHGFLGQVATGDGPLVVLIGHKAATVAVLDKLVDI
jgi:hypothetical protein